MADPIATKLKSFLAPAAIAVAFVFSRVILYASGVTFYSSFVHRMWQTLDISQLSEHLVESIWYLHAQPPLFNVLIGLLVKVFPHHYDKAFLVLNLLASLLSGLMIYWTLRTMKVRDWLATLLALALILNPAIMLYENIFSYTILTIFLLSLALYLIVFYLSRQNLVAWALCCATLAVIVLTRSSFHLFWMIAIVTIAVIRSPRQRRPELMLVALLPIIVASSWYLKNYVVFGTFSSSSWLGMNMARIFPPASPLGQIRPFRPLQEYDGYYKPHRRHPEIHVLTDQNKVSGYVNYNHEDYVALSQLFRDDVIRSVAADPWQALRRVPDGLTICFAPATHAPFVDINLKHIQPYAAVANLDFSDYNKYQALRPTQGLDPTADFMLANGFTATAALPAALLFIAVFTLGGLIWIKDGLDSTSHDLLMIVVFILAYGMLVGNLLEFGENNRFRLELSPAFFVLSGIALDRALLLFQKIKH